MKSISKKLFLGAATTTLIAVIALGTTQADAALNLTRQLDVGARGADVTSLQQFLATNPTIYPEGLVTGYYGSLTKAAVARLQAANNLPSVGRVGPLTLSLIASMSGSFSQADVVSPIIRNVVVSQSQTSATVTWNTNEPSRGKVYYSTSMPTLREADADFQEPYISGSVAQSGTLATNTTVNISGLSPNTVYYYTVVAIDERGNVEMVMPNTFVTR